MTAREFFDALYSTKNDDEWVVVADLDDGHLTPRFFNHLDDRFYSHIEACDAAGSHVYFGVGLTNRELTNGRRGTKEQISALPGLWVDVDIEGPGHRKAKLFKTEAAAMEVIKTIGLEPSITVRTGGGLHLYFLFTEIWRLTSTELQERADRISQGFQTAILREAKLKGATIDMTGDITRILRVPGTLNKKNRVMCEVLDTSEARYEPEQFFKFEDEYPIKLPQKRTKKDLVISSKISGQNIDLDTLLLSDPEIRGTFYRGDRERHDSESEVDLGLASKMAWMELTPDVVATAVVASRTLVDAKALNRPDYVARTVARAYVGVKTKAEIAEEQRQELTKLPQELTDSERQDILKHLSERFGVKIVNVIEYTGTRHSYEIVLEHGKFDLGTTDQVMNWRQFNSAVMQCEHRTIPPMKSDRWNETLNLLLQAVEMKDTGGSGDDETWLKNYLFEYCRSAREYPHDPKMEYPKIDTEPKLYVKENERYIHAGSFKAWLKHETRNEEKITISRFAARMVGMGCVPRRPSCRVNARASAFDAWLVPRHIWDWSGGGQGDDEVFELGTNGVVRHDTIEADVPAADAAGAASEGTEDDTPF